MGIRVLMIGAYPREAGVVVGGIESVTSTLVPALGAHSAVDRVTVLCFRNDGGPAAYRSDGDSVEIYHLRGQKRLRTVTGSFLDVRRARRLAARLAPDVVHGQEIGWFGDVAVRCGPCSVVTVHGLPHVEIRLAARHRFRDRLRTRPVTRMVTRVLRRARVVISISGYDRRELAGLIRGVCVGIPNPIAREFFDLAASGPTEPRLLFAGVLSPRKNPEGMLRAFALARRAVPAARLTLMGPHPDRDYAREVLELARRLGVSGSVDVTGLVDDERMRHELARARAVVLFSWEETAPTIIAQAMAASTPVVASRVGGVAEMVRDGDSGFVVEPGDVAALAQRMIVLLTDQDLCSRMGESGHAAALDRFEPGAVADRTVEAYRQALAGSRSTQGESW
ncbi:conserved hypothetical protein [Rhodococcus sp. RD6.2]|uniref:glycosyltransferase family 4 protein n=1 Tax=Rhodococcus sp. RD6.2 TaxID=260936 RepID=UPI00063B2E91|nr:glycosyltransferase family 4 protein [Rhodococcus sp. RD6.2]CRK49510.1 conserved hypothetical protein [Rhodococcus sp. RD6.2]